MSPRTKPTTDYEQEGGGDTVVRLSFSVAELIKTQAALSSQMERMEEKNEQNHEATRRLISDLRTEIKNDFATKKDLESLGKDVAGVRKDTDSNTSNMNKVAMLIIGTVITGAIGLLFAIAQR